MAVGMDITSLKVAAEPEVTFRRPSFISLERGQLPPLYLLVQLNSQYALDEIIYYCIIFYF